ncbi:hypothetical protein FD755_005650, partial [Muntiacus reevesi]
YILEPPPCRSDPENCTDFCTLQEDCQPGFQCCSAFCGIVCTLNKYVNRESSWFLQMLQYKGCSDYLPRHQHWPQFC